MDASEALRRLRNTRVLFFEAHSATPSGWNGTGNGNVTVEQIEPITTIFHERGTWTPEGGKAISFTNVFRWTEISSLSIRLEHLRFGADKPVFLFDLIPISDQIMESAEPHICREDLYVARMEFDHHAIRLTWTISGPAKNERIFYLYQ